MIFDTVLIFITGCILDVAAQNLLSSFTCKHYICFFGLNQEYLLVRNAAKIDFYNFSSSEHIRSTIVPFHTEFFVNGHYYYQYLRQSTKIEKRFIINDTLVQTYTTTNSIDNNDDSFPRVSVTDSYVFVTTISNKNQSYELQIFDQTSGEKLSDFPNGSISFFRGDESGFITVRDFILCKFDFKGNLLWELKDLRISSSFRAVWKYSFLFVACDNIVYQLNNSDGTLIRTIGTSNWYTTSIAVNSEFIFIGTATQTIIQFTIFDGQFIGSYRLPGDEQSTQSYVLATEKHLLYVHCKLAKGDPSQSIFTCQTPTLLKWTIKSKGDETLYLYQTKALELSKLIERQSVIHKNHLPASKTTINSVMFINPPDKLLSDLPQNTFFNPVLSPNINSSWSFLYFSGAGTLENGRCLDNHLHKVDFHTGKQEGKITRILEYKINSTNVFPNTRTGFAGYIPDLYDMLKFSATYDYASILVTINDVDFYVIHGGCACYFGPYKSSMYALDFNGNSQVEYLEIEQKNPIA
jgi:hypothetical protein